MSEKILPVNDSEVQEIQVLLHRSDREYFYLQNLVFFV